MVLGVTLVNGRGEQLNFGGTVMKNVAGYDVSRLQAGALGTLGVITEVSLKVLPRPEDSLTLAYTVSAADALEIMNRRAAEPRPLTGAFWADGRLYLRLAGPTRAVQHAARDWGGERLPGDNPLWQQLRDMQLPFFTEAGELWRLSVRSTAPVDTPPGSTLIDWGGALRWVRGEADFPSLQSSASAAGGHAALFRGGDRLGEVRQQPEPVERRLLLRLKQAFDPDRVLNPGRLHSWL
jgi:glycolate oxidase FAD binding subunit